MSLFTKKSIGLDIADRSIELIELEKKGDKTVVASKNRVELSAGIVERGRIKDQKALEEIIKKLFAEATPEPIKADNIIFGLPESIVYVNVLELPPHSKDAVDEEIKKTLVDAVPEDINDLLYYFHIIKEESANKKVAKKSTVLTFSAREEALAEWIGFFRRIEMEIEIADIESLALARGIFTENPTQATCVMDLGAETANISIFDSSGLVYSFVVYAGGNLINAKLSTGLKIDLPEAEKRKIQNGIDGTDLAVSEILRAEYIKIAEEVKSGFDYFEKKFKQKVEKIILVGGSAKAIGLAKLYQDYFNMPSALAVSPLLGPDLPFEYLEASGLALRGLGRELWPDEESFDLNKVEKAIKKNRKTLLANAQKKQDKVKKSQIIEIVDTGEASETPEESRINETQNAQIAELNAEIEKKLKKQKIILVVIVALGLLLVGTAFIVRGRQEARKQAEIEQRLNQIGFVRTYDLKVPLAVKPEEYTVDRVRGRLIDTTIETAIDKNDAVQKTQDLAQSALAEGEVLLAEPINLDSITEPLSLPAVIRRVVYNSDDATKVFLESFGKINVNNINYSLNSLDIKSYELSENPGVYYLHGSLTVTLDQPLERVVE